MGYKTIIVDDDFKACKNLKILIDEYCPDLEYSGEAYSIDEAEKIVNQVKPSLIFLDMKLGPEQGFELLDRIDLSNCKIIVASAFEDFAFKAFQISAIDYLLKPINIDLLVQAVQKAKRELDENRNENYFLDIISTFKIEKQSQSPNGKISIPTVFGSVFIRIESIIRCEAERNYTRIFLKDSAPFLSSKNLREIESLLPTDKFERVHHSHLINLNHMVEFHKGKQSYLVMDDDTEVPISQNKKNKFVARLKGF